MKISTKELKEAVYAWQREGGSIAQYCKTHNISEARFYYWKKRLLSNPEKVKPSDFKVMDMGLGGVGLVEYIHPGGGRVVFHQVVTVQYLKQLLD